jgi:MFS family permease
MGWTNPWVLGSMIGGIALLVVFCLVETRVADPMFELSLFRIRAFSMGNLAGLTASMGRGGMQFMLIIWLQGIWLPLHGYSYESTPLWAGIYLLPLTIGFLVAGPLSGWLSDRYGARLFAVAGLLVTAAAFVGLVLLPVDFDYRVFAVLLVVTGLGSGLFSSPNASLIMNSVPARQRGVASGMRMTAMNMGQALSIGVFFSLMVIGLAASLPGTLSAGLQAHGVPVATADQVGAIPPVGVLFAAFLGYNPIGSLLGPSGVLASLPHTDAATLTGTQFFPDLISAPFHDGLALAFGIGALLMVLGAVASWCGRPVAASGPAGGESLGVEPDHDRVVAASITTES